MKQNQWALIIALSAVLLVVLTATYWNHFNNGFHFDDSHAIVNNSYIKDLKFFPEYFTDARTHSSLPTNQAYRPILTLSLAIDYFLAGNELSPFYFHLSTFLWHLLLGVLMFFTFRQVMQRTKPDFQYASHLSLFAVGWFLLHTVNAETLNYISARSDVLSTVGVVAALFLHIRLKGWLKWLSLVPMVLGALVKPTAVMYWPILLVYIFLFENEDKDSFFQKSFNAIKRSLPALIVCGMVFWFTQTMEPETWVAGGSSPMLYILTQPFVIIRYFYTFFIPVGLSADTDWTLVSGIADIRFIVGSLFLLLMVAVIIMTSRSRTHRPITFGLAWFLLALAPTSSVIPLSEVTNDHRMYFPFVGLVLSASWAGYLLFRSLQSKVSNRALQALTTGVMVVILVGNVFGTVKRNKIWSTDESLWHDVTIKSPRNGRGLMNYGLSQMRLSNYEVAIEYFSKAFETDYRNHPYLYLNMAIAQDAVGNETLAKEYYEESIIKGYNYPDCHYFYARWLYNSGRSSEVKHHLEEAIKLSPAHESAKTLLKKVLGSSQSDLEQALALVGKEPTAENYLNLSLQYYFLEDFESCIGSCNKALELKPDYALAYNNICSAYNKLGNYAEAAKACKEAIRILPGFERAENNLKYAESQMGQ